jgi:2',3'-cyclic-nucleotide 2'-phosphodiesterase (5'-nucleotidase family)
MNLKRSWTYLTLISTLIISLLAPAIGSNALANETASGTGEVTILHDTHFHGNFGELDKPDNIANYIGLVNHIRSLKPGVLFLGNGDDIASSLLSSVFKGQHIIDALNAAKLDANTFGNHDFDLGPEQITSLVGKSEFPWVSANLIDKRTNDVAAGEAGAKRFVIKEVNGVKVGLTGLINEEAPDITSLGNNIEVLKPIDAMKQIIPEMQQAGADIIVVLSHLAGPDAEEVAAQVTGIDVIVGDHAGNVYDQPKLINDTIVSFVGDEFKYLGELTLKIENGDIIEHSFVKHSLKEEADQITPDPTVKQIVEDYQAKLNTDLEQVVGETTVELDVRKSTARNRESNFGSYIADALRTWAESDVALVNGGGIRSDKVYPAGSLTKKDIMSILPFTNYGVKLEVTGQQIKDALENGVSKIENGAGRFSQVSGMSYIFDPNKPAGSRIIEVKIGSQSLDLSKTYTLATLDFVAEGGDGYEVLTEAKTLISKDGGPLFSTLIIETIQKQGTISPAVDGRIKVNAEQAVKKTTTYKVVSGDVLWKIARDQLGDASRWNEIYELNKDILSSPHRIHPGQTLKLPN